MYKKGCDLREFMLEDDHPDLGCSYDALGRVLRIQGKTNESEDYTKKGLELRKQCFPKDHSDISFSLNSLGSVIYSKGKY